MEIPAGILFEIARLPERFDAKLAELDERKTAAEAAEAKLAKRRKALDARTARLVQREEALADERDKALRRSLPVKAVAAIKSLLNVEKE